MFCLPHFKELKYSCTNNLALFIVKKTLDEIRTGFKPKVWVAQPGDLLYKKVWNGTYWIEHTNSFSKDFKEIEDTQNNDLI